MKKLLLINLLLTLFTFYASTQCGMNEVEVRVEITTDPYGNETYWTLTDLIGTVVMQGGQGGVYQNHTSYTDSICVPDDGCFFFEIYDTYGDGIYTPNGYKLYVNEILVSSGADDIKSYAAVIASCPNAFNMTLDALNNLQGHINEAITLSADELTQIRNTFVKFSYCRAESESMILLAKSVVEDYDNKIGALFTTPNTENGFSKNPASAPGLEVERSMVALQQGIFDDVFTPDV